jgi:hypothetical protein
MSFCYLTLANGSFTDVSTFLPVTWPSEVCVPGCKNNNYTTLCDVAIRNEIKSNLIPILASMLPFGALCILVSIFNLCMTRKQGCCR